MPGRGQLVVRAMVLLLLVLGSGAGAEGRMALIIDDVGNNRARGEQAIALPGRVTLSVLPGLPNSRLLAEKAHAAGLSVMLHMPMENYRKLALGPKGLQMDMSADEIAAVIESALVDVPFAEGMNNHMGSRFTENADAMASVMRVLQEHELYFVDSLTSPDSVAIESARSANVPALARHVFLDHERSEAFLSQQLAAALRIMDQYGSVVVIGHPYPETLEFLAWVLPMLKASGVELVSPRELMTRTVLPETADRSGELSQDERIH